MSTSVFIQGMAGDPLSLPPEYHDLLKQINSDPSLGDDLADDTTAGRVKG